MQVTAGEPHPPTIPIACRCGVLGYFSLFDARTNDERQYRQING